MRAVCALAMNVTLSGRRQIVSRLTLKSSDTFGWQTGPIVKEFLNGNERRLRYTTTAVGPVRVHIAHVNVSFLACAAIEGVNSYDMAFGSIDIVGRK